MKRTASFAVDREFDVFCDVTKYTTLPDGRRLIRGVASGTVEDQDGERVSARAIAEMAAQGAAGLKVVAGTHAQDWTNEIGDVSELRHDPETDELVADAILPAEGEDPLADKACRRLDRGEKLGWSIGGKLRSAYEELVETPGGGVKKRKVLDRILLKHLCLTEKPAYATSVVGGIAKCAKDFVVDDSIELLDVDPGQELRDAAEIAKATKPEQDPPSPQPSPADAPADAAAGPADGEAPADDSAAAPAAGTADTSQPGAPAADPAAAAAPAGADAPPSDAEAAQGLPLSNRHLSCPNCGEEFAAPLPDTTHGARDQADQPPPDTGKTHTPKENTMDVLAQLAELRKTLADVEKTVTENAATDTVSEPTDVERMLAVVHKTSEDRADATEAAVREGFELVAKTVQTLAERVNAMPQGRRTAAFTPGKPDVEVNKTATDEDVQKTAEAQAEGGDLIAALKTLNKRTYGV